MTCELHLGHAQRVHEHRAARHRRDVPGETAAYKTRILVYRPTSPRKFSGTVVVEWLNVSGGVDAAPDWTQGHVEMLRKGVVWVACPRRSSASKAAVDSSPA
jgi:hypothetical protein